jgi:hypothetical protein
MGLGPDKWGVHGWKFIHHVALGYPNTPNENQKNNYKSFYTLIGSVLPCHICSDHYNEHLLIHPLTDEVLSSKINLINWTIDMHNEVNKIHGKKIYNYDEALELIKTNFEDNNNKIIDNFENIKTSQETKIYIKPKQTENKSNNTILYMAIIIFIILIIIAVVYKKK